MLRSIKQKVFFDLPGKVESFSNKCERFQISKAIADKREAIGCQFLNKDHSQPENDFLLLNSQITVTICLDLHSSDKNNLSVTLLDN